MAGYLLDSGILIRHLRRQTGYVALLDNLAAEHDLYIAAFLRVEIIGGMREHERAVTYHLLDSFLTVPLDIPSANLAGELIRSWRAQGIILAGPDASIAACALHRKLALITTNAKHFPMEDLSLWSANASGNLTQWR